MSDFRRTLPLPPPGTSVGEALEDIVRHHHPRKTPAAGHKLATPRAPQLSSSPGRDFRRSKPGARRTLRPAPPRASDANDLAPPLDEGVATWIAKGRALSAAIEQALQSETPSPSMQAAVDRAYASWNLDGVSARQLSRVAHLSRRAHEAIRDTDRSALENAYADCARVLHLGLPSALRRHIPIDSVVEVVRAMRREGDSWFAIVEATMSLVGWADANRARAAEAIRLALEQFPPHKSRDDDGG